MPDKAYSIFTAHAPNYDELMSNYAKIAMFTLRTYPIKTISNTPDCSAGLENLIKKTANNTTDYFSFLSELSSSRYPIAKIKRICLHTILGITKTIQNQYSCYARLLGIKKDCIELLSVLPKNIIKKKSDEKFLSPIELEMYNIENYASRIYNLIKGIDGDSFYKKLLII